MALILAGIASVAAANTTEKRIADCAGINDNQQRLVCFDALARDLESQSDRLTKQQVQSQESPVSSAGPEASTESTAPLDPSPSQKFGLEHKQSTSELPGNIQAIVTELKRNAYGQLILRLDNGQTWQQKDSKTIIIHKGDLVFIERGVLGAFYLKAGGRKLIKVARVK